MDDVKVRATRDQIEDIKTSMFWIDVMDELNRLKIELSNEYDLVGEPITEIDFDGRKTKSYPSTAEALIHLGDIKGRKKAIEYFLSLPDIFLNLLEVKKDGRNKTD